MEAAKTTGKTGRVLQVVMGLNRTGIDNVVMNLYRHIDREHWQFDFAVFSNEEGAHEAEAKGLGAKIFHITPRSVNWKASQKDLETLFHETNYQIVHAHQDCLSADILRRAKEAKVPIRIAHAHTTQYPVGWRRYYYAIAKHQIPCTATHLMACSEAAGRWMFGQRAAKKGRIFILNNAVDTKQFAYSATRRSLKRKETRLEKHFVLLNVGRLAPVKNQAFLLDMMPFIIAERPECALLIAGTGELEIALKEQCKKLNLEKNVCFLGEVSVEDYYQAADAMLMPSLFEGVPLAAIEAQIAGLPVFLSSNINPDVMFTPSAHSLPLEAGPKAWAKQVLDATGDHSRARRTYAEEAREHNFDIIGQAKLLSSFYDRCLECNT